MQITSLDARWDDKKGMQEPVEEVETVNIKQEEPEKTIKIESKIKASLKKMLVTCLRVYADVFT